MIRFRIRIQEFFWRILQHCEIGHFPQFGSYLWTTWLYLDENFTTNVALKKEAPVKFWKSCGSEVRIRIGTPDTDSETWPDSPWRRYAVSWLFLFDFSEFSFRCVHNNTPVQLATATLQYRLTVSVLQTLLYCYCFYVHATHVLLADKQITIIYTVSQKKGPPWNSL